MADLEKLGLLDHPHTSAGRIPIDDGDRYFVDALMGREPLPARDAAAIRTGLRPREGSPQEVLENAVHLLSRLSRNMAFVLADDKLSALSERITASPHVASVELPLPDQAARERFLQFTVGSRDFSKASDYSISELAKLTGHQGEVPSAVFSPDGHTVLTAGNDGTARLWA